MRVRLTVIGLTRSLRASPGRDPAAARGTIPAFKVDGDGKPV